MVKSEGRCHIQFVKFRSMDSFVDVQREVQSPGFSSLGGTNLTAHEGPNSCLIMVEQPNAC